MQKKSAIVTFLEERGLITEEDHQATTDLDDNLVLQKLSSMGLVSEKQALSELSLSLDIPLFTEKDLNKIDVVATARLIGEKALHSLCLKKFILPVYLSSGESLLLVSNPFDVESSKNVMFSLETKPSIHITSVATLKKILTRSDPEEMQQFDDLKNLEHGAQIEILSNPSEDTQDDSLSDPKAPIVSIVNKIIVDAIHEEASDIHLEPNQWSLEVRNRIDGELRSRLELPKRLQKSVIARIKLISNMDIAESRKPQDGRLQLRVDGSITDLRVSSVPTAHGECLVLRILRTNQEKLKLDKLNLPDDINTAIRKAIQAEGKMLLVTGPTGSGKTTTLYSCLNELISNGPNIVTVEDPVEYRFSGVNQIQVNEVAGITFASALRSIMRQDPDVILIGEIRDKETADIAIQAAQTGHLVLSTLHTNDAPSAITRLIDLGVEPYMVSSSVAGVVAQRLVRKLCTNCRRSYTPDEITQLKKDPTLKNLSLDLGTLMTSDGCVHCDDTGYIGRVGIFSFLNVCKSVAQAINNSMTLENIISVAEEEGFQDLNDRALRMVSDGITCISEIKAYLHTHYSKEKAPKEIGIFCNSGSLHGRIFEALDKETSVKPYEANPEISHPETDLYILDSELPESKVLSFFKILNERKKMPSVITLGDLDEETKQKFQGEIVSISTGHSPLSLLATCKTILDAKS